MSTTPTTPGSIENNESQSMSKENSLLPLEDERIMSDANGEESANNGPKGDLTDPFPDEQSPDEVWSPTCQRRNLRLDFSRIQDNEEDGDSPKSAHSPAPTPTKGDDKEKGKEPSPPVWQPFGQPQETPQFRSVKIDASAKKDEKAPNSPTTEKKKDKPTSESKRDDTETKGTQVDITTTNSETGSQTNEGNIAPTTTALIRTGRNSNLPPSQSPTVTLLQKAREGQIPKGAIYIDDRSDSKGPPLPKNAVLIDQKVTVEGDKVHTDSYYAVPASIVSGEVSTQVIKAPSKYDGIGPTEYGIPVGLRTGVKDEYASDWYKTMYRSLHKSPGDARGHLQTVHLGGYMSAPEFERRGEQRSSTLDYRQKPERSALSREISSDTKTAEKQTNSITEEYLFETSPSGKNKTESYRNQPRSIADYEPGHSSLADKEFQKFWDDFWDSLDDLHEHFRQSPRPQRSYEKTWSSALLRDGYESDSTLIRKSVRPAPRLDPEQQKAWYKEIQKGGEIPFTGLRKPAPSKPKESPHQYQETEVNIHYKSPIRNLEKEYIEEEELRKRQEDAMRRFYAEERLKKQQQQEAEIEMRRHRDNFTPSQKSPIPLNRYDNPFDVSYSSRLSPDHQRTLAQVLYPFVAQTTRELSLNKGDIVYINKQVDRNWYEGEHHGFVGIFPVSYVTVIPTEKANFHPKEANEGYGIVKYNFRAKTPMELSLFKGERVILTRRVDQNWFEGRLGTKKGIFPVSYIDVVQKIAGSDSLADKPTAISPKPTVNQIHSPISNGSASKLSSETTLKSYHENQVPVHRTKEKPLLTQSLQVDTYNEPIPYRSLYSYLPQNDDELELREGDTVYVMEKCDDGWYVGTSLRTGLFGTFPGNYVERI